MQTTHYFIAKSPGGALIGQLPVQEISKRLTEGMVLGSYVAIKSTGPSYSELVKSGTANWITVADLVGNWSAHTAVEDPDGAGTQPTSDVSVVKARPTQPAITIGIIILVIGVALIIISPSLLFVEHLSGEVDPIFGNRMGGVERITDLRNVTLFLGVALLIVGGIISAVAFSQFISARPTPPPAPTTQPVEPRSVSPKMVELGNTSDEVQSVMGQPDKVINLGARVIHVYKDMKIIYVDGKVSDVQLS